MTRGFDQLMTPLGLMIVGASIMAFAFICAFGAKTMKIVARRDEEARREARALQNQARTKNGAGDGEGQG